MIRIFSIWQFLLGTAGATINKGGLLQLSRICWVRRRWWKSFRKSSSSTTCWMHQVSRLHFILIYCSSIQKFPLNSFSGPDFLGHLRKCALLTKFHVTESYARGCIPIHFAGPKKYWWHCVYGGGQTIRYLYFTFFFFGGGPLEDSLLIQSTFVNLTWVNSILSLIRLLSKVLVNCHMFLWRKMSAILNTEGPPTG